MKQFIRLFITLLKCGLLDIAPDEETLRVLTSEMMRQLYATGRRHDLEHVLAVVLEKSGCLGEDEVSKKFLKAMLRAMKRYEKMRNEEEQIQQLFEEREIDFVLLKGSIVAKYYPTLWMRTRVDIDVLVREEDVEIAQGVLEEYLHYAAQEKKYHDVVMVSPNKVCVELHFSLLEHMDNIDKLLSKAWDYVLPVSDGSHQYAMQPEYLAFHILAHMSYHFLTGGCGARPIIDMWFLKQNASYDEAKLYALCEQAGILKFAQYIMKLTEVWFEGEEHDSVSEMMERYILANGLFGTTKSKVLMRRLRGKGKFVYVWSRMFPPYEDLCVMFPKLKKMPLLYPYYSVKHWGAAVEKGKEKEVAKEIRINQKMKRSSVEKWERLLKKLDMND